jgi:hypothetical protein
MRIPLPGSVQTIRIAVMGMLVAACTLWGIEHLVARFEVQLTGDPHWPSPSPEAHPFLLWEMPPGNTEVNGQTVAVNAIGARGPAVSFEKAASSRRVLVLGDGVAFGEGVQRPQSFALDAISSLGGDRVGVEPIVLAVPDYSIVQTRNLMGMRGWDLAPDLLIFSGPGIEMSVVPYVDSEVVSAFRGTVRSRRTLGAWALTRVLDHLIRVQHGSSTDQRTAVFAQGKNTNSLGRPRVGTNEFAAHLDALASDARAADVELVFVMLPLPADLHDKQKPNRAQVYRSVMVDAAHRYGIPLVDGPKVFKESARKPEILFQGDRLLTSSGHRLLGYALSKALRPWMRGGTLNKKGTGANLPRYAEPPWLPDGI